MHLRRGMLSDWEGRDLKYLAVHDSGRGMSMLGTYVKNSKHLCLNFMAIQFETVRTGG